MQERGAAFTEQIAVTQFVDGVLEIEPAQQRIRRHFGGAQDVAAAVALDLAERNQLPHPSIEVGPHPVMKRTKHAIDECAQRSCHRLVVEGYHSVSTH